MNDLPSYYAIIPATVRYDKRLSASSKLLYAEITALTHKEGYCWAEARYFSDLYDVDIRTVQRWLVLLEECDYIEIQHQTIEHKDYRKIYLKNIGERQKCHTPTPYDKKVMPPRTKMSHHNNDEYYELIGKSHHPSPSSKVVPIEKELTDDLPQIPEKEETKALATKDNKRPMQHNIDYRPTLAQEVYPGVFIGEKDLEECLKIKNGSLEEVMRAFEYIQKAPGRKQTIQNWPKAFLSWQIKVDPVARILENQEMVKKYTQHTFSGKWPCQMYHETKKDQKGILFFDTSPNASKSHFVSFMEPNFKKIVTDFMWSTGMIKAKQNEELVAMEG